jgi:hypothetical protein
MFKCYFEKKIRYRQWMILDIIIMKVQW